MKSFDEVVYCKTQEEWDAVVNWSDHNGCKDGFKENFGHYEHNCVHYNECSRALNYGSLGFFQKTTDYGELITFQEFKDKYMKETEGTSQTPSEPQKFKSDGGVGMEGNQVDLFKTNVISFVNAVESVRGSPSVLLPKNMELLEALSRNGLKLTLTKEK